MKIKDGFMLREIAGSWIVVPLGQRVIEFNGLMTLNESGALLWDRLISGSDEDELVGAIRSEYEVEEIEAQQDVRTFLDSLIKRGLISDEYDPGNIER